MTRREFISKTAAGGASLLTAGAVSKLPAQGESAVILENEFVRIEVAAQTGDIVGLRNKRSGRQYLGDRSYAKVFRLNVPFPGRVTGFNADYSANSFDSWRQNGCSITRQRDEKGETLRVRYGALSSEAGTFPIEVEYTLRLESGSDEAILQLEVANHSPHTVREVFFPWISGVREVEGIATDTFVAPNMIYPGVTLREHAGRETAANWEEFPYLLDIPTWPDGYSLSMPWMNYGGQREGLYLASRARTGIHHMLMVQDYGEQGHPILAFAWAFPCYLAAGKAWRSPEMILSLHEGDWHAAADKYRASLDGWYAHPQTQREFRRSFASFNSFYTKRDFGQLAELAEDISKYDLHHLVMWNFGDYYPKVMDPDDLSVDPPRLGQFAEQWGGPERLQAANRKAHELGVSTGIIFSQRLWNKDALTPELKTLAEDWVIRRESGDPITESWDHQHLGAEQWSGWTKSFGHLDYIMCSGVEGYRDFAIQNVRGTLKKGGYSMMFYDQVVENNLCFSPRHRHDDVNAPSIATLGFVKLLKAGMKQDNPDAVLIGEGWEVLASQHLDSGWVWRLPPNPEVLRYTLPWVINSAAVNVEPAQANRNFVLGLNLAIVAGGIENGKTLSDFPDFARHVSQLAGFHKATERFWIDGSFQDDLGLEVSGAFAKVYMTSGEVAIMMANLEDHSSAATFRLDAERYAICGTDMTAVSSQGAVAQGRVVRSGTMLSASRTLAPYEVTAVIFSRGAAAATA